MESSNANDGIAWHALSEADALVLTASRESGLSGREARDRLKAGSSSDPSRNCRRRRLRQTRRIVLCGIVGASIVTGALGMGFVALGIALAGLAGIAVEAGVYFFTKRARVRGLNGSPRSVVWRDSILVSVAPIEVVVGDVVELAPGIRVAADARLLVATNLCCKSEAGDVNSNGLQRSVSILPVAAVGTARTNMVFAGDRVTSGSGRAVIVSTS